MSLSSVSELDFISFGKYWSEFQTSLIGMNMFYPELKIAEKKFVFFGWRSLDELAFRSYEIHLLSQFAHEFARLHIVGPRTQICEWMDDCDVILAALMVDLGFNNYRCIV